MKVDLRTPKEIARDERNESVCKMFLALVNEQPGAAPYRIFGAIAQSKGLSAMGVMRIVERAGLYSTKKV